MKEVVMMSGNLFLLASSFLFRIYLRANTFYKKKIIKQRDYTSRQRIFFTIQSKLAKSWISVEKIPRLTISECFSFMFNGCSLQKPTPLCLNQVCRDLQIGAQLRQG